MSVFPPPATDSIDWTNPKDFKLHEVNGHIESTYYRATDTWTPLKFVTDPHLRVHGLAAGLNYGLQALEGLKAFRTPGDPGSIALFRPDCNAQRLQHSATVLDLPAVPAALFERACRAAVARNAAYVPPHAGGWALYVRPLLFASGPTHDPDRWGTCTFAVYAWPTPAGAGGPPQPVCALVLDAFDRAAPRGTGHAKVGGNYAGVTRWSGRARAEGFGATLHLDSARREHVDEFSLMGFLGVKRRGQGGGGDGGDGGDDDDDDDVTLVVPDSPCAIKSVTSESVQQIARSWGWKVETRPVPWTELPSFSEVFGTGTTLSVVPVRSITRRQSVGRLPPGPRVHTAPDGSGIITYMPEEQREGGPVCGKLFSQLRAIQLGTAPDEFGWRLEVQAEDLKVGEDDASK